MHSGMRGHNNGDRKMSRVLSAALVVGVTLIGLASLGFASSITCGNGGGGICSGGVRVTSGESPIFLQGKDGMGYFGDKTNNGPAVVNHGQNEQLHLWESFADGTNWLSHGRHHQDT